MTTIDPLNNLLDRAATGSVPLEEVLTASHFFDSRQWEKFLFLAATYDPTLISLLPIAPGEEPQFAVVALLTSFSLHSKQYISQAIQALLCKTRNDLPSLERLIVFSSVTVDARFLLPLVADNELPMELRRTALRSLANSNPLMPRNFWLDLNFQDTPEFLPIAISKLARQDPESALLLLSKVALSKPELQLIEYPVRIALRALFNEKLPWQRLNLSLAGLPDQQAEVIISILKTNEFSPRSSDHSALSGIMLEFTTSPGGTLCPCLLTYLSADAIFFADILTSCLSRFQVGARLEEWQAERIVQLVRFAKAPLILPHLFRLITDLSPNTSPSATSILIETVALATSDVAPLDNEARPRFLSLILGVAESANPIIFQKALVLASHMLFTSTERAAFSLDLSDRRRKTLDEDLLALTSNLSVSELADFAVQCEVIQADYSLVAKFFELSPIFYQQIEVFLSEEAVAAIYDSNPEGVYRRLEDTFRTGETSANFIH